MKFTLKKLASSALISAMAMLAAPAAHADVISFENVANVIANGLNAGDTTYNGGQRFTDSGFNFTVRDSAIAESFGLNGLAGAIIDGSNPFNCAIVACPSGNASNYFGGLNDGSLTLSSAITGLFHISSLNFAFIAPLGGLDDGIYGQLRLSGLLADGSVVSVARDFPSQDGNGSFTFETWNLAPEFAALELTALTIDACLFDGAGACLNDVNNPAFNQAQFAIDNLQVAVPLPGTASLILLGMAGLAVSRRRRAAQ